MVREEIRLESKRFTSTAAFVREILALLECSDYKLNLIISADERERLDGELEGCRTLGRVAVKIV